MWLLNLRTPLSQPTTPPPPQKKKQKKNRKTEKQLNSLPVCIMGHLTCETQETRLKTMESRSCRKPLFAINDRWSVINDNSFVITDKWIVIDNNSFIINDK